MANVHPWFANVSVDDAAAWTWNFFQTVDVELAQGLSNKPDMSIAETGELERIALGFCCSYTHII